MKNIDIKHMRKNAAKRIFTFYRLGLVSRSTWKRAIKMKSDAIEWNNKIRLEVSTECT